MRDVGPSDKQRSCRLVNWNVDWAALGTRNGDELRRRIDLLDPEIICITEGHPSFLPTEGHLIVCDQTHGYHRTDEGRKVMLWSKRAWSGVNTTGHPQMPSGRFVSGVTETSIGRLRFIGVCIPWSKAHVYGGRRDRQRWEDHVQYLEALRSLLSAEGAFNRTVLAGDFNQRIPRGWTPPKVYDLLLSALAPFTVATAGLLTGAEKQGVDHVVHTSDLHAVEAAWLSAERDDGKTLSDHDGVLVELVHNSGNLLTARG